MTVPTVSVVIVTYGNSRQINRCLDALAAQTWRDFEAIVIDNASPDGTAETVRLPDDRFRLIRNAANLGFAAANNQGARLARGAWIATLNPDAYAAPDWLAALVAGARQGDAVMAGSTQVAAADPRRLDGTGDCYWLGGLFWRGGYGAPAASAPTGLTEPFSPCAAAALWRRDAFLAVGGFDEDFFCYGEDVDLGFRLRLAGGRAVQVPSARVQHEGYGSSARRGDFATYHGMRNRTWVLVKNMPLPLLAAAAPLHAVLQLAMLVRDMAAGVGGPSARGLRDALRGLPGMLAKRRAIQRTRRIGSAGLLPILVVNPLRALRRVSHARPVAAPVRAVIPAEPQRASPPERRFFLVPTVGFAGALWFAESLSRHPLVKAGLALKSGHFITHRMHEGLRRDPARQQSIPATDALFETLSVREILECLAMKTDARVIGDVHGFQSVRRATERLADLPEAERPYCATMARHPVTWAQTVIERRLAQRGRTGWMGQWDAMARRAHDFARESALVARHGLSPDDPHFQAALDVVQTFVPVMCDDVRRAAQLGWEVFRFEPLLTDPAYFASCFDALAQGVLAADADYVRAVMADTGHGRFLPGARATATPEEIHAHWPAWMRAMFAEAMERAEASACFQALGYSLPG